MFTMLLAYIINDIFKFRVRKLHYIYSVCDGDGGSKEEKA